MRAPAAASERSAITTLTFGAVFATVAFTQPVLADGDTWWHLAAGEWVVRTRTIPAADPFSHSALGAHWIAHEWGAEIIMWLAYQAGGWAGLITLTALCAAAATAILVHFVQRHLSPAPAMAVTGLALLCLIPSTLARPHLVALPILMAWVAMLLRHRERDRAPSPAWAVLILVWANVHASVLLGLALAGAFALDALLDARDRRTAFRRWLLFGLAAFAAALINPRGLGLFLYPLQHADLEGLETIKEWWPTTFENSPLFFTLLLATLLGLLLLGVRFRLVMGLIYAGLVFLAMAQVRHQFVFGMVGWMIAAAPLAAALEPRHAHRPASAGDRLVFAGAAAATLAALVLALAQPVDPQRHNALPIALIERLPADLHHRRVFNSYSFGGPLILAGIPVFMDGRAEMYGTALFRDYRDAAALVNGAWPRILRRHDIEWTILRPGQPLVGALDRAGWQRILADERAVVHVRPDLAVRNGTARARPLSCAAIHAKPSRAWLGVAGCGADWNG